MEKVGPFLSRGISLESDLAQSPLKLYFFGPGNGQRRIGWPDCLTFARNASGLN